MPPGIVIVRILATIAGLYVAYAYLLRFERQAIGHLSLRGDPKWGLLWPLVSVTRALALKSTPPNRRLALLYSLSPWLTLLATGAACTLVPLGPGLSAAGLHFALQVADLDLSLLLLLSLTCFAALGVFLHGASSGQPPVLKAGRAVFGHALVYSLPVLLAFAGPVMLAGSWNLDALVLAQCRTWPYLVYQPLGLLVSSAALLAGSRRLPFELAGDQNALLRDFHLQHVSGAAATFHLAEYVHILLISTLLTILYLAGWCGPWLSGWHWMVLKTLGVAMALLWLRAKWLLPWQRRVGQQGWMILMLLAVLNALLTSVALAWLG